MAAWRTASWLSEAGNRPEPYLAFWDFCTPSRSHSDLSSCHDNDSLALLPLIGLGVSV